jgi:hypothetical protein
MHAGHTVRLRSASERERRVDGARLEITLTPRLFGRPTTSRELGAREGALLLSFERPGPGVRTPRVAGGPTFMAAGLTGRLSHCGHPLARTLRTA